MFGNNFYGRLIYGIARKLIAWTPAAPSFQIDIDYTPTPPNAGDVILTTFGQLGNEENQTGNTWALILNDSSLQGRTNDNQNWQSFKRNVGMGNNTLRTVQ